VYRVKEIFYTLQGEGARTGRPAVFCRFSGCNLWSGKEEDRKKAICNFCDTDFLGVDGLGGGKFKNEQELSKAIKSAWPENLKGKYVVLTGGEPALQVDSKLIKALHSNNFEIAIETNGTLPLPPDIDWVTVSPKANTELKIILGDELKLVFPQEKNNPNLFSDLNFKNFYLQPLDNNKKELNTQKAVQYCLENPIWSLSLQAHKFLGIP
tara:strand:- start:1813 stop:2442 length:630 start_codon:yes stop_codon:yes gene_type:complete